MGVFGYVLVWDILPNYRPWNLRSLDGHSLLYRRVVTFYVMFYPAEALISTKMNNTCVLLANNFEFL